jgi:hypothetical protein
MWFREDHPNWGIETQAIAAESDFAFFRAVVRDEAERIVATGHKSVRAADFPGGHIEKAETGAIARALELLGYGTEFGEFDESDVTEGSQTSSRSRTSARPSAPAAAPKKAPAAATNGHGDAITGPQKDAITNLCQRKHLDLASLLQEKCQTTELSALTQGQASELIRSLNETKSAAA